MRVALERKPELWQQQEDRADGGERELEARLEQGGRGPRQQDRRTQGEEVPAIARTGEEPRERGQATGDSGAHDRRLPADCEDVGSDRADRRDLGRQPVDPQQPGEPEHSDRKERDVLSRDGQQVVEPGGLEVAAELVGEPLVLAEHDSREHGTPVAGESRGDRARNVRAEPVGDAADPTARAHDPPVAAVQHDMDAAARQPAAFVEAVLRTARSCDRDSHVEDGALGRRAADGELEQDSLAERARVELTHLGWNANREWRLSRGAGHDDGGGGRAPDLRREHGAVERVQPGTSPPPAGENERERTGRQAHLRGQDGGCGDGDDEREDDHRRPHGIGERNADAAREDEERRPTALDHTRDHGETRSRSCSTRAGPIPGIASRSSTERKPPCAAR